ncbi:MAG: urease accessory protein UreF [Pseudomonadota bacterium]
MATDAAALHRLLAWLSPSFPVGAFTFSHGLERAIDAHLVTDAPSAEAWLAALILQGSGQADLTLVAAGWDATTDTALASAAATGVAYAATRELYLETTAQGAAFVAAIGAAWPSAAQARLDALLGTTDAVPYPVALGHVAADQHISRDATLHAYAHAFVANLISAIVRAVPLGQSDGQRILAGLEPVLIEAVDRAAETPLTQLVAYTPMSDICSMQHEVQYTRLFRS